MAWLYLAIVLDLFSREIVGWSLKPRMTTDIVTDALTMAWFRKRPAPGEPQTITQIGLNVRQGWQQLADKHEINIGHWGLPALTGFTFQSPNALAYKTLVTQEMLAKGYLVSNTVYACTDHAPEVVAEFLANLDPIFALVKECEEGRDGNGLLKGPVCHGGFKRLN